VIVCGPLWHERLVEYLCEAIGLVPTPHIQVIGRTNGEGKLVGVVGYDNWNEVACEMHMAGEPGWITREFMRVAFDYPFNKAGLNMVLARVPCGNPVALEIDKRLGFELECTLIGAHQDGALHILSMRREDCRHIKVKHGQEQSTAAAA
jgi:RimJ/RimL family protein N-acetyltransferase